MKIDIQPTVQLRPHPKENCIPSEILAQSCLLPITDGLKRESVHPIPTQSISGSSKKNMDLEADSDPSRLSIDKGEGGDVGHGQGLGSRLADVAVNEQVDNGARAKVNLGTAFSF